MNKKGFFGWHRQCMRVQKGVPVQDKKDSLPVEQRIVQAHTGAPSCIRMEGSYMAEFAVALPFFVGFMAALLFFFQMLAVQQEVGGALLKTGRELSVLAYKEQCGGKETGMAVLAQALLQKNLGKHTAADRFIRHGRMGISLLGSDFLGSVIELRADYRMCLPIALFRGMGWNMTQKLSCRKWIGRNDKENGGTDEIIVYITSKGTVYHKNRECSYIKPAVRSVLKSKIGALRNQSGARYAPCKWCLKGTGKKTGTVYVTRYGDRYHGSQSCSRISRTAFAVFLSKVKDRSACSKCGKEQL